jgi:hypothetical protein
MKVNSKIVELDINLIDENEYIKRAAYIAGLFDGEGSYLISRRKKAKKLNGERNEGYGYTPVISIDMTDFDTLNMVAHYLDDFGIKYAKASFKSPNPRHKSRMIIRVSNFQWVELFICLVKDYAITKPKQMALILNFIESRRSRGATKRGRRIPFSEDEQKLYWDVKELNRKGVRPDETASD